MPTAVPTDVPTDRATTPVVPTARATTPAADGRLRPVDAACVAFLALLSVVVVVVGAVRAPSLSAYDEVTHIDYVRALADGRVPAKGDPLSPVSLGLWSCLGQDNAEDLPACGEGLDDPQRFPNAGENYNFGHPPVYYGLTALVVRLAEALRVDLSFVTVARLTGAVWLAAGLAGLYVVLRRWSVPRTVALSSGVLVAAVPSVAHASSTVSNDAPAVLGGVLAFWVLTRIVVLRRLGWVVPTVLALLVASTKLMTSISMLAVAGVVGVMALGASRRHRARASALAKVVVGVVGATLAVFVGWGAFQQARGATDWQNPVLGVNSVPVVDDPVDEWLPTLFSVVGITKDFWLQDALASPYLVASARLLAVVLTAAPFMVFAATERGARTRAVGWAALLGVLAVPLVVQSQIYLGSGYYFPEVTTRYGLSLLPLTVGALALVVAARRWASAYLGLAVVLLALLVLSFAGVL